MRLAWRAACAASARLSALAVEHKFEPTSTLPNKKAATGRHLFGAGDEIRTHDPNLGKVVLYP